MASLVLPHDVPSPTEDIERLRKAFEGYGTDRKTVTLVLGHRNSKQLKEIRQEYKDRYDEALIDRLNSELSGDFRNSVILWTTDPAVRYAKLAKDAVTVSKKGLKQLQILAEIACASTSNHLMGVRQAYCDLFDCSLEEDIIASFSKPTSKVLVSLVSSFRSDKGTTNLEIAKAEASKLNDAIKQKHLDDDQVILILSTRNLSQLRETFKFYKEFYGNSVEQDIQNSGNGELGTLLQLAVVCIDCPEKHFAKVIRESILGFGTDEDALNRAIVTRAEIDLEKVKSEYIVMYKTTVEDDVIGDTSGDYKDFLLTLLGSGPSGF